MSSQRILPNPGTYEARRTGPMVVEVSALNALLLWIPYALVNAEVAHQGKHCLTLGTKEGQLMDRNIEALRKVWPEWTSNDPFDLQDIPLPAAGEDGSLPAEFELADCFHDDSYVPKGQKEPVIQFKANWFNPIGGSANMPSKLDDAARKKVLTTWGGRFKAAGGKPKPAGGSTAQPAASSSASGQAKSGGAPSRPAAAPARKGNSTSAQARTMTQDEVWNALEAANPDENKDALGDRYWAAAEKVAPGKEGQLSLQEWGKVADELGI